MSAMSATALGLLRPGALQPRAGEPALPRKTAASGADALLQAARAAEAAAIAAAKTLASGPMPAATAAAYQAAMLQRPLVAPVPLSERLAAFQTRDLLASRGERVAHAAAAEGGPAGGERAATLMLSLHAWQVGAFAQLEQGRRATELDFLRSASVRAAPQGQAPGSAPHAAQAALRVIARPYTASVGAALAMGGGGGAGGFGGAGAGASAAEAAGDAAANARWITARQRELAEERGAAQTDAALLAWRLLRKKQAEGIEHNIQMRRRPKSANLTAKVEYRRTVKDALLRPATASSGAAGAAGTGSGGSGGAGGGGGFGGKARFDAGLGLPAWAFPQTSGSRAPTAAISAQRGADANALEVAVAGRTLVLPFAPSAFADPELDAEAGGDLGGLGGFGGGDPGPLALSRPTSAAAGGRPGSGGGGRPSSSGSRRGGGGGGASASASASAAGLDAEDATAQHQVRLSLRLPTPLVVTASLGGGLGATSRPATASGRPGLPPLRPATSNGRNNASSRRADRPSAGVWWNAAGRAEAMDKQEAAARAEAEAEAAAAVAAAGGAESPTRGPPPGPAGVPLLPETSIPAALDVLAALPALRAVAEREDAYDVESTVAALARAAAAAAADAALRARVQRALASGGAAPVAAGLQAARPVTATSGFFGLGANPLARERLLAAQRGVLLEAAKKAAAAKAKGAKGGAKK